jgi:hypothetical protein
MTTPPDMDGPPPPPHLTSALGSLVQLEAHRALSEAAVTADPERLRDGWERRFVADLRRAEEALALYRELGYEVCADPIRAGDLADECDECQLVAMLKFRMIYTRRR